MKIPFKIGDKNFVLLPYTTFQEKEILLASSFGVHDFDNILDLIGLKTEYNLSDDEKRVLLYKYREISSGDEIDIKFKCQKCKQGNDGVLEANSFFNEPECTNTDILKLNKEVTDENLHEFVPQTADELDELDVDEFDKLKTEVQNSQITFDFNKKAQCMKCGHMNIFDIGGEEYIIEIMSDDTLMTMYKSYNFLIFFGHYSKIDVDTMYPFERSVFVGLLNKNKEDLNK